MSSDSPPCAFAARDDLAGQGIGGFAQFRRQRRAHQAGGMGQSVILVQQFRGAFGDIDQFIGGEILERRQGLHQAGHDADFTVGHAAIRGGNQDHGQNQRFGRVDRNRETALKSSRPF